MTAPSITTFTGRSVNPLALVPSDVCLEDVAHHLACVNRFVGALPVPVSVAQHSVYVSRLVEAYWTEQRETEEQINAAAIQALFHDGAEAYLGDISKWVKHDPTMKVYRDAEHRAQIAVYEAFGCAWTEHPALERADRLMVRFEAWKSWGQKCDMWRRESHPPPTVEEMKRVGAWKPWTWRASREAFHTRFRELTTLRAGFVVSGRKASARATATG